MLSFLLRSIELAGSISMIVFGLRCASVSPRVARAQTVVLVPLVTLTIDIRQVVKLAKAAA